MGSRRRKPVETLVSLPGLDRDIDGTTWRRCSCVLKESLRLSVPQDEAVKQAFGSVARMVRAIMNATECREINTVTGIMEALVTVDKTFARNGEEKRLHWMCRTRLLVAMLQSHEAPIATILRLLKQYIVVHRGLLNDSSEFKLFEAFRRFVMVRIVNRDSKRLILSRMLSMPSKQLYKDRYQLLVSTLLHMDDLSGAVSVMKVLFADPAFPPPPKLMLCHVLKRLFRSGIAENVFTAITLASSFLEAIPTETLKAFQTIEPNSLAFPCLPDRMVPLTNDAFQVLVNGVATSVNSQLAIQIVEFASEAPFQIQPDASCLTSLLHGCLIPSTLSAHLTRTRFFIDNETYRKAAIGCLNSMKSTKTPMTVVTYSVLLNSMVHENNCDGVLSILKAVDENGLQVDEGFIGILARWHLIHGTPSDISHLVYDEYKQVLFDTNPRRVDTTLVNVLVEYLNTQPDCQSDTVSSILYDLMKRYDRRKRYKVQAGCRDVSECIDALFVDGMRVVLDMRQENHRRTVRLFITRFIQSGQLHKVEDLLAKLDAEKAPIDCKTILVYVLGVVESGESVGRCLGWFGRAIGWDFDADERLVLDNPINMHPHEMNAFKSRIQTAYIQFPHSASTLDRMMNAYQYRF